MSTLSLRLPNSLHEMARQMARDEHVSINHLISTAVAEKVSALATETYLRARAAKGSRKDFERIMSKVPDVPPDPGDELWQSLSGHGKAIARDRIRSLKNGHRDARRRRGAFV